MSTTAPSGPSPEIWNNVLKGKVEKDDPLWTEYLDKAAVFDVRMVDEWNKIVDVLLVYVALFIGVLTSFIGRTTQFQRNPAIITNDLLVAIYTQLAAQSNNTSIPPVDPRSYFNQPQADYDVAVAQNALLYVSLSLSIIVSVIALAAKLWLVSYSQQAFSVGSPYDRAMKRQEAYNGVLVWNMGRVINMLPVILLIALYIFGFYVYSSVWAVQEGIGDAVGILLGLGLMFLAFTSAAAVIVPGCPFRSAFSDVLRPAFEKLEMIRLQVSKLIPSCRPLGYSVLFIGLSGAIVLSGSFIVVGRPGTITAIVPLIWILIFLVATTVAFAIIPAPLLLTAPQDPQKYKIPYVASLAFFIFSVLAITFFYFQVLLFPFMYFIGIVVFSPVYLTFCSMSKSMADTGEIDAIAWLSITTPQLEDPATFFKKAGQMTGVDSIGCCYRPRLLESLVPLLSPLITSYHAPEYHNSDTHSPESDDVLNDRLQTNMSLVDEDMGPTDEDPHLKNLEIYIACLARLSEFTDYKGWIFCLREDARRHPKLEQPLIHKLVELANLQRQSLVGLMSAATKVLNNYKLDMEGNPLGSPTTSTVLENVTTRGGEATSMSNDNGLNSQEPGHSELYRPVEYDEWTVERRWARSSDSPGRVPKNSSDSKNPNGLLTTEQAHTVEAAASNLTGHQKNSISDRQKKISAYRESDPSSRGEGPSNWKGKNIDPREWGQVNISLENLDIEAQNTALNSIAQAKEMTTHRKDEYHEERNSPATRRQSRQASRSAESRPATQIAKVSYLGTALNKDPSTRIKPSTHVEPPSATTSILSDSGLNSQERGHSELYRPEDPATRVGQVSAAISMFHDSDLDSQEQGLPELNRPVNPATRVESEECEIGDKKIEEVKSQVGEDEIDEMKRDLKHDACGP